MVLGTLVLALAFDLSAIASLGSAVALLVFTLVTVSHLRVRRETSARVALLVLALVTTGATLLVFMTTTLADEPATMAALIGIIVLSIVLDLVWKRIARRRQEREGRPNDVTVTLPEPAAADRA
jgi:O-antigen/teichoic acid export membrane protein